MREIYTKFMNERERTGRVDCPATLDEVFDFAYRNHLWTMPQIDIRARFRLDMARALREDYFADDRGRPVRRFHAATYREVDSDGQLTQQVFWADILSD